MSTAKTALIIGASRGLGLGLVKTLLADGWQVTATVRNPQNAEALQALGKVRIEKLDMDDQQAVIALSQQLKGEMFDLLFVNAGVKGPEVQTPGGATLAKEDDDATRAGKALAEPDERLPRLRVPHVDRPRARGRADRARAGPAA